ncbi:MAG: response regulator [Chitinophagales bacterium]|nr:response regulator [Chitinophagales bacterium]
MKTILLIEDNLEVRENTAEILELANYKVVTAENGKEGVEKAVNTLPDLIICDIMMPEMDGYGVLHILSKNDKTNHIPFIFLSAKANRGDVRKGMEMGADDYLTKPFEDIELLNAIESRLKRNELLKVDYERNTEGVSHFLKAASQGRFNIAESTYDIQPFKKKQAIYSQGRRPSHLYFIAKGKVKTFKMNNDAKELITAIYKEGDFMGYTALLEDVSYQDSAEVLEDGEIMMIPKSEFLALVGSDTAVAKKFISILTRNLVEKEEQLLNLAYNSLRKRVADGLLHVYSKFKSSEADKPKLAVSREDLAQVVGTAKESLIRTLSDFKSEQLIDITEGKITILNEDKLRNLLY